MAEREPSAAVIICSYTPRRWRQLVAAVDSVRSQTTRPAEILVVIDHCPELARLARRTFAEEIQVIASTGRRGLSGARNTGVAASRSDVVAFLDDDAVAEPGWLACLLAGYREENVLGVGGRVEPVWQAARPRWFPTEFDWVVGCSHSGLPASPAPVRNFVGANMSFRRGPLAGLDGFRTELGRVGTTPAGCEETELCIRLAQRHPGAVLRYEPAAAVRHHVPPERASWSYFRSRCYAEGRSKALVATLAGGRPALSAERDYVRRTLPLGVARAARAGILDGEPAGLARAAAIVAGLAATSAGYLVGRLRQPAAARTAAALAVLLAALVTWATALPGVDLRAMSDLGLVSVLPPAYWIALTTLVVGAAVLINGGRASDRVLTGYLASVIVVVHATPAVLYGSLRYSWTWKHVGIVDYISRHGLVDPKIDNLAAYHAWPGFFALNAVITKAAGLTSALPYAAWAPPVFALLALIPLRLLFGTLVADRRQIWLALLLFYLANWVGQEYFSPQAFAYLLHLVVLAVCLRWLPGSGPPPRWRRWLGGALPGQATVPAPTRRALLAVVVLLMVAVVSSHQLTPFMLLSALTLLCAGRVVGPAWLPGLLAVLTVAWIALMATGFLKQNLYWIVESIGRPAANTQTSFVDLGNATAEQRTVNYADRALTGGIGLLAAVGFLRAGRTGSPRRVAALLAVSPLPLLAANNYGGEMLFRVYLFALPFLALLAAGAVYPRASTRRATVALPVALTVLMTALFCLAYYGKERMNYFTPDEVAASNWLYGHAPPGSMVVGATTDFPWAFTHYEDYEYVFLENLPSTARADLPTRPVDLLEGVVGNHRGPVYLVLTRSEAVSVRYTGVLPATALPALLEVAGQDFRVVYHNADATIAELAG